MRKSQHKSLFRLLIAAGTFAALTAAVAPDAAYVASIEQWREERRASLLAEDGYLAVADLYWLEEGEHRVGTDPSNDFVLPEGSAPARTGVILHRDGKTRLRLFPGVDATANGLPFSEVELSLDDVIRLGDLSLNLHRSGSLVGIRLRDRNSKYRRNFVGLRWYPIDPDYRVIADFVPYEEVRIIQLPKLTGEIQDYRAPGYLTMELKGERLRLDPVMRGDQLFLIFSDGTSGRTTYPAARFLYANMPVDGKVVVDFNQAINPACAFSPFTTCPYPPKQNRLKILVEAGAKKYLGNVDP